MFQSLVKLASTTFPFGQLLWQLLLMAALQTQPDAECIGLTGLNMYS